MHPEGLGQSKNQTSNSEAKKSSLSEGIINFWTISRHKKKFVWEFKGDGALNISIFKKMGQQSTDEISFGLFGKSRRPFGSVKSYCDRQQGRFRKDRCRSGGKSMVNVWDWKPLKKSCKDALQFFNVAKSVWSTSYLIVPD